MKKFLSLMMVALVSIGTAWAADYPDVNYLLLNGQTNKSIAASQIGGTGVTWSCNPDKYTYGNTTCTFYGNSFSKGLKHEGATFTQLELTETATLTIVQSLATNPTGTLRFENTADDKSKKEIAKWDNYLEKTYEGEETVGGKKYKNVKVMKLFNLPAGTYKIHRGTESVQTYVVYMGVTYETTPSYTISTGTNNGGTSTVSGGGSFLKGFPVTLTASAAAGKAFDHWELDGAKVSSDNPYTFDASATSTYTAVFVDAATKSITVASSNDEYGTTQATETVVAEGSSTTLTATPAGEAYYFTNWTKSSDANWSDANASITIEYDNLAEGETYTANFAKKFLISYSKGTYVTGTQTKYLNGTITKYADGPTGNITMPVNYGIVYSSDLAEAANYTLKSWSNGGESYNPGAEYALTQDEADMAPVFAANGVSIRSLNEETTITWPFASNSGAPAGLHVESATGYYVVQKTIDGETIDVPMFLNNTSGKFVVTETRAQVNAGSKFTIPAVKGMVVTYTADSGTPAADQFATDDADNVNISVDNKVVSFTYNGTNSTLTITDNNGNYWPKSLSVTYPKATSATLTVSDEITDGEYFYTTFSSDKALDFSEVEGVTAYVGVKNIAGWDSYLELTEVQQIPANTGVIIKAAEAKEYTIPFAEDEVEAPEANDILAAVTTVNSSTVTNGYLIGGYESSFMGEFLYFRSIGSVATDIPAGTAYLSLTNDEEKIAYGTVYVKFPAGPATDVANVAALKEATDEVVKLTLDSENGTLLTCIGAGYTDYYYTLEDATGATLVTGPADLSANGGYKFIGAITLEKGYGVYKISDFSEMTIASLEQAEPSAIANVEDDFEWRYIKVTGGKYNAEAQSLYIPEKEDNFGMMDITYTFSEFPADGSTVNAIGYIYDGAPMGLEGYCFQPVSIEVTVPVTVTSVGYATFSSDKNLDFTTSSIKAYTATISGNQVDFNRINKVPANTGVLLWAAGGATEDIPVIDEAPEVSNAFKVAQYDMNKSQLNDGGQAYVLGDHNDYGIGFYQPAEGFTLPAGKCYLQIWEGEARIFLPGMEATGIGATLVKNEGVKNEIFNLNGQRINKLQKGLNIVNGRKVVVK